MKCSESVFTASLLKARTQRADQAESYEGGLLAEFASVSKGRSRIVAWTFNYQCDLQG